ncbi:MAG TPA: ATP-binding protein [Gemmatimonadaceae bacterium]|nr:ATP-binding protein [Gemmatimonadaceae bacterium]
MSPTIVDRAEEQSHLSSLLDDGEPRLVLLYGRRRVGKTHLLTHLWPTDLVFYFTASATTPEQNRRQLIADLAQWSGEDLRADDYPTWRSMFRLLLDFRSPRPLVVVLDEFQYLGEDERALSGVASELNAAWEQRRPVRSLVVILSGSSVRTLEALAAGGAPLHGRFAWQRQIHPFDYWHAAEMTPFRLLRDRACAYGIFGGTPRYLAAVKTRGSLAENAAKLMLAPSGEVRELVRAALLQEQGLRETTRYTAILRAIGSGRTELNEIRQRAGLHEDTGLRDKIERLVAMGYVRAERNLGAGATTPFRYRLADPAFMFLHGFVLPLETALERNDARQVWRDHIAPVLDTYMGRIFEQMVEQAYARLSTKLKLPMVHEWGRWEGRDRDRQPLEIDIACRLTDGRVMTGGVKWNRKPLGVSWHHHHMHMLDRLSRCGVAWAHDALKAESPLIWVAAGGFTPAFEAAVRAARPNVILWTLEDMYRTSGRRVQGRAPSG